MQILNVAPQQQKWWVVLFISSPSCIHLPYIRQPLCMQDVCPAFMGRCMQTVREMCAIKFAKCMESGMQNVREMYVHAACCF